MDFKVAAQDDVLPNGMRVCRGWRVTYMPWAMGRDTDLWGADACTFAPARWLSGPGGAFKQPDAYTFPVFQAGPRICLGMNMAVFEASLLTAMLLRRFRLPASPAQRGVERTYARGLTMNIEGPLLVTPKRR